MTAKWKNKTKRHGPLCLRVIRNLKSKKRLLLRRPLLRRPLSRRPLSRRPLPRRLNRKSLANPSMKKLLTERALIELFPWMVSMSKLCKKKSHAKTILQQLRRQSIKLNNKRRRSFIKNMN